MKSIKNLSEQYPRNEKHMQDYISYQEKYKFVARESDLVLASLLGAYPNRPISKILDIGCSTGNLLRVLRKAFPGASLCGVDLNHEQISYCKNDPSLNGIEFSIMDIQSLSGGPYDAVAVSAVVFCMDDEMFKLAATSIFSQLAPGGCLALFDFFHPFVQDLTIVERSAGFPDGLPIHFRSYDNVKTILKGAGFHDVYFKPFEIPFDLEQQDFSIRSTYTKKLADGTRVQFRGCLSQPWNHAVAIKK